VAECGSWHLPTHLLAVSQLNRTTLGKPCTGSQCAASHAWVTGSLHSSTAQQHTGSAAQHISSEFRYLVPREPCGQTHQHHCRGQLQGRTARHHTAQDSIDRVLRRDSRTQLNTDSATCRQVSSGVPGHEHPHACTVPSTQLSVLPDSALLTRDTRCQAVLHVLLQAAAAPPGDLCHAAPGRCNNTCRVTVAMYCRGLLGP
jgi:hypothetical protein